MMLQGNEDKDCYYPYSCIGLKWQITRKYKEPAKTNDGPICVLVQNQLDSYNLKIP